MGIDGKRAPSDLAITTDTPVEELDLITVRPQDYSGAIEGEIRKSATISNIYEPLSNIADTANNLNRELNNIDFSIDYEDRKIKQDFALEDYQKAAEMSMSNAQFDTYMEMSSELDKSMNDALNNGESVTAAAEGVLDNYRDAYSDTMAGADMWNKTYMTTAYRELGYARQKDIEVENAKTFNNIDTAFNQSFQDVATGKYGIDESFANFVQVTADLKKSVPEYKYKEYLDNVYNQNVIAKALQLENTFDGSNGEQVASAIRDLVRTHGRKAYGMLNSDGSQLKGADGKQAMYDASLTPNTVQKLLQTASEVEARRSSTGTAGSMYKIDNYDEYVRKDETVEKGVSDYTLTSTPMSAQQDYETTIQGILNDSNDTPKGKLKKIQGISSTYYLTVKPAVSAAYAMRLTPDSMSNKKKIAARLPELRRMLDSSQDMRNYSMNFDLDNGGSFSLALSANDLAQVGTKEGAYVAWRTIYNTLEKTVNSDTNSDFVYNTNRPYNESVRNAMDNLPWTNIVGTDGSVQQQGVSRLTAYLSQSRSVFLDSAGKSSLYPSVPSAFMDKFATEYSSITNPVAKHKYSEAVAKALKDSKYSDFVLEPSAINSKNPTEKEALNSLMSSMYLSAPGLETVRATINNHYATGAGKYTTEAAQQTLKDKGMFGKDAVNAISDLLVKYHVPKEYHESLRYTLSNSAIAYASGDFVRSTEKGKGFEFKKDSMREVMERIVKMNFVDLKSPYVKESIYISSPILQGRNRTEITNMINTTGKQVERSLKEKGINTSVYRLDMKPNSKTGSIDVRVGGKTLGISDANSKNKIMVGIPYNTHRPYSVSTDTWNKSIAQYVATNAVLAYSSNSVYAKGMASKIIDPATNRHVLPSELQTNSIKLMDVMQEDGFLSDFSEYMASGSLKYGATPAPAYLKKLAEPAMSVVKSDLGYVRREDPAALNVVNKMIDYAFSKTATYNKVNTVQNKQVSNEIQGVPYTDIMTEYQKNGFSVSRDFDPTNVGNVKRSFHNIGWATDIPVYSNNMENPVTGTLKLKSMDAFTNMITKNPAFKDVDFIFTSRPELLDDKPQYAAYAKYRNMKNKKGQPLFRDARMIDKSLPAGNNHANHFHVQFTKQVVGKDHKGVKIALPASSHAFIAQDIVKTQNTAYAPIDNRTARALVDTFASNFGMAGNGRSGIAGLTKAQYMSLGIPEALVNDPIMQSRAMANRYKAYANALGSKDLAIFALAGGKFKSNTDNKIRSIEEILTSGNFANSRVSYKLAEAVNSKGKPDAAEQARLNSIYKKYKQAYSNERG